MIELISQLIFGLLLVALALYSLAAIYALLRFGRSKTLGIVLTIFYLILMVSLYSAAQFNFDKIRFPQL